MTFQLPLSLLSDEEKQHIIKTLVVKPTSTIYDPYPASHKCYLMNKQNNTVTLPIGLWETYVDHFPNTFNYDHMNINAKFTKTLLTADTDPMGRGRDQDIVIHEALLKLKNFGSVFLCLFTGYGKMMCGIYLSILFGLKTLILTHLDIVKRQWIEEYEKFSDQTVKVQYLNKPKIVLDPTADVYIIGIQKCTTAHVHLFSGIGTVIIDEAHIVTLTAFTQTLFKFKPRYLIGLSATPDRSDGLHQLFQFYFGDEKNYIIRKEKKPFCVYKVNTLYQPTIQYKKTYGKVTIDWNVIVHSIEENEERWQLIVDIIQYHPQNKIIVMCNRKVLAKGLYQLLITQHFDAELLIENTKIWNKQAKILVTSFKKAGTGFNDPLLDMAIIASDTKDVRQYEGRIRTTNNIIYHLVDCYKPFENHYKECQKWYENKGGVVHHLTQDDVMLRLYYKQYLILKYLELDYDVKNMILNDFIDLLIL